MGKLDNYRDLGYYIINPLSPRGMGREGQGEGGDLKNL